MSRVTSRAILFFIARDAAGGSDTSIITDEGDDNCDSGYWQHVRGAFARDKEPSSETVARLLADEALLETPAEGAGCEAGRLVLSAWHLVHTDVEERAWHLQNRFGVGFYALKWRPRVEWPVFRALSSLRRRVQEDPKDLYPANSCDYLGDTSTSAVAAETKLQEILAYNKSESMWTSGAAAASRFLLKTEESLACPLAVGVAFWTLAMSFLAASLGNGGRASADAMNQEVEELLDQGEEVMRRWGPVRLSFLDMLTTAWPFFDIGASLEELLDIAPTSEPLLPSSASVDPLHPACPFTDRNKLAEKLASQRVEAVVVYGRRERVEILHRYLLRNLRINGGVLDRIMFVVFQATTDDIKFLSQLVADHAPYYDMPPVTGRRLAKIYSVCTDSETVYVKIDDDIVYIADEAIPDMVLERLRHRCAFVSANVVNHAILSSLHQDIGAIRNFIPDDPETGEAGDDDVGASRPSPTWIRADNEPPFSPILRHAQSECVWKWWQCAAWMHESFLSRLSDGTACAYDFGWHDFHAHGYGSYKGDKLVPLPYTRWSINMIAFMAKDLEEASLPDLAEDDESELSYMVPHRLGRRGCAVGRALVAHFSYSRQEDELIVNTNLLERYHNLSIILTRS